MSRFFVDTGTNIYLHGNRGTAIPLSAYEAAVRATRGLIGYWRFNETGYNRQAMALTPNSHWLFGEASGNLVDSGPGGLGGVKNGAPTYGLAGPISDGGTAISFDGTADYFTFGNNYMFSGTASFSISFWIWQSAVQATTYAQPISKDAGASDCWLFTIFPLSDGAAGKLQIRRQVGGVVKGATTSAALPLSQWNHIVATYDGSNIRLYLNGTLQQTTADTGSITANANAFTIGRSASGSTGYFAGRLSRITVVSGRAVAQSEVTALYAARTYVDATTNAILEDSAGNQNHGKYLNGMILGVTGALADSPTGTDALNPAVTNNIYAQVSVPDLGTAWSVEAWVKPSTSGVHVYAARETTPLVTLYADTTDIRLQFTDSGGTLRAVTSGVGMTVGVYTHLVFTHDGTTVRIYKNGVQIKSDSTWASANVTAFTWRLGAYINTSVNSLNGSLDEAAIYNRAMTATEIAAHYQAAFQTNEQFTLACRFKPSTAAGLLFAITSTDGTQYAQINATANKVQAVAAGATTSANAQSSNTFSTGAWHTAVAVFAGPASRAVFLDGVKATNTTNVGAFTKPMTRYQVAGDYDGYMAELAVWNRPLTDAEATAWNAGSVPARDALVSYFPFNYLDDAYEHDRIGPYPLQYSLTAISSSYSADHPVCESIPPQPRIDLENKEDGLDRSVYEWIKERFRGNLLGYWRLNDASGSATAADSSGASHTLTASSGLSFQQLGLISEDNAKSVTEFATTKGFHAGNYASWQSPTTFSITGMLYRTGIGASTGWEVAILRSNTSAWSDGFGVLIKTTTGGGFTGRALNFFVNNFDGSGDGGLISSAAITNDTPHMFVAQFRNNGSGGLMELYLDGVLVGTDTTSGNIRYGSSNNRLQIGNDLSTPMPWLGFLSDFSFETEWLTAAEVAELYALRLATGWRSLLPDVRSAETISCSYGITGDTPNDRIANTGTLQWGLDNSERNSVATRSYYSPLHASKKPSFDFNIGIRLKLYSGSVMSYKHRGSLSGIVPTTDPHGAQVTRCQSRDWMDKAARNPLPSIDAQTDKRGDELIELVLDGLPMKERPITASMGVGLETYSISMDGAVTGQNPKVREGINQIVMSGLDYSYVKGDSTQGGTFVYENRHNRGSNPVSLLDITDADIQEGMLVVPGSIDDIVSLIQVFVKPTGVDATPTTILYDLQTTTTLISAGETNDRLFGPYRDPVSNDNIGGTALQAPISGTTYIMNTAQDGSGTDVTANFTVTPSFTGLGVRWTITNNGALPGYVIRLRAIGKAIRRYQAIIEAAVPNAYGDRTLPIVMPYQNSINVGTDAATYFASIFSSPLAHIRSIKFMANISYRLIRAAIEREVGDRVTVNVNMLGINSPFSINSVRLDYNSDKILYCTWGLEPASAQNVWLWGIVGASEWGINTVYGF